MQSLSVVEDLDITRRYLPCFTTGMVAIMMNQFGLQGMKGALHRGIASAVAFSAHAWDDSIPHKHILVLGAGVLNHMER